MVLFIVNRQVEREIPNRAHLSFLQEPPKGRPMTWQQVSRPFGTQGVIALDPAMNCRAIFDASLRDARGAQASFARK